MMLQVGSDLESSPESNKKPDGKPETKSEKKPEEKEVMQIVTGNADSNVAIDQEADQYEPGADESPIRIEQQEAGAIND